MTEPTAPAFSAETATHHDEPVLPRWLSWLIILGAGVGIWAWAIWFGAGLELERRPAVKEEGWRLLAIFVPVVLALMLRPIAGGAAVLLGVSATVILGALPIENALAGYADKSVWLVLAAYFIARALIKTGLARRIALLFIRLLGRNSLGLSYAMVASDTLLAGMIPSNAARVGGVLLPITKSLAELYKSFPGKTAGVLGAFLMLTLYQGDVVACALFLTGQASNPMAADRAKEATLNVPGGPILISYASWFLTALLPAVTCLLLVPWLIYRWNRPEITHTPEAANFARAELARMGSLRLSEWVVIVVFGGVCVGWIFSGYKNTSIVALIGAGALLLSGVLTWEDCIKERGAWDVFIWYGGLVQLGNELDKSGLTRLFAGAIADLFYGWPVLLLFLVILLIYFYAHYAFASITTHIISMYPAFASVLILAGAPPALVVYALAYFTNFSAGLTNYGTTPAPIVFSTGYVNHNTWWKIGFLMSLVNVTIWLTVGMFWWWVLGLW